MSIVKECNHGELDCNKYFSDCDGDCEDHWVLQSDEINNLKVGASIKRVTKNVNTVYTDELMQKTGATRESITRWLKVNGFYKPGGPKSKRWVRV